jgi:uncharacterized protein
MNSYLLLIGAAFGAGLLNSVAGGGSFLTFPALVFTGVPSVIANASSTVALFPGVFASAWAYRRDFRTPEGVSFRAALVVSVLGGVTGALLLLYTSERSFDVIIPWLLLIATLTFAFGRQAAGILKRRSGISPRTLIVVQFLAAVYGGYFGGAVGIILLAAWSLAGLNDIHALNANRTLLGGVMNAAAVVCFAVAGTIWWLQTGMMLIAAVIGGYLGARVARRMNPRAVRALVTIISITVTTAFFFRK